MPEIGHRETVTAFTLDAEARGGLSPKDDSDHKEYEPPEGYILINHKEIKKVDRGVATASTGTAPAGYRIISTDDIQGSFDAHAEWRYAKVWGKGDLNTKWDNMRRQVEEYQKLRRRIVGDAKAISGGIGGAGAHIRVVVEAVIEYVGTPADASQYSAKLVKSLSVPPNIFVFEPKWNGASGDTRGEYKYRSKNQWWTYELYMYSTKPEVDPHFFYYGLRGKAGTYKFAPTLRTGGSPRQVTIALREEPAGSNDAVGSNTRTITVNNTNTAFDIEYKKQRDDTDLYVQIMWKDDGAEPLILDNLYTFIIYP